MQVGSIKLGLQAYNNYRGKFNRMCACKPKSGRLDVPESIHKIFLEKGNANDQLFENFVKANGDKDFEIKWVSASVKSAFVWDQIGFRCHYIDVHMLTLSSQIGSPGSIHTPCDTLTTL